MIHFFLTRQHSGTVRGFVETWARELADEIRIVPYDRWPYFSPLANGACVFSDLERLLPSEMRLAIQLARALRTQPENFTILNDPARYAGRFNLQVLMHQRGINDFRVGRFEAADDNWRFPVFLRSDLDHEGPLTPLLQSRNELNAALKKFAGREQRRHLMIVEYCDCADGSGIFRKYSAMNINGALIPRHVLFSKSWVTKTPDSVTEEMAREEMDFVSGFPRAEEIKKIFQIAGVNYGRIDYGLCNGRVQVWEINTNPVIIRRREKIDPRRLPAQSESSNQIVRALKLLSAKHKNGSAFPFRTPKLFAAKIIQSFCNRRPRQRK